MGTVCSLSSTCLTAVLTLPRMPAVSQKRQLPPSPPPFCWPRIEKSNPDLITQHLPRQSDKAKRSGALLQEQRSHRTLEFPGTKVSLQVSRHQTGFLGERPGPVFSVCGLEKATAHFLTWEDKSCRGGVNVREVSTKRKNAVLSKSFWSLL